MQYITIDMIEKNIFQPKEIGCNYYLFCFAHIWPKEFCFEGCLFVCFCLCFVLFCFCFSNHHNADNICWFFLNSVKVWRDRGTLHSLYFLFRALEADTTRRCISVTMYRIHCVSFSIQCTVLWLSQMKIWKNYWASCLTTSEESFF